MNFKSSLLLFLILLATIGVQAQHITTENSMLKGWTEQAVLTFNDFQGKPDEQFMQLHKDAGLVASAMIGINSILDVPKRKKDRDLLLEKAYIAPFFIKSLSISLTDDSVELEKQSLYFDMAEIFARKARKEFEESKILNKGYGVIWKNYSSVMNHFCKEYKKMANTYTFQIFIEKKPDALLNWKQKIKEELAALEKYATTSEDCYRLLSGKPIDKRYMQSKKIVGAINGCN